jgi:hypothetical protein
MPKIVDTKGRTWTYGAEHEFADWDTSLGWPAGYGRDPEPNICNSNGIAADPTLKSYQYGAEINTPPTDTPEGQADALATFLALHPRATANWRGGLHIHIRVPGLKDSLPTLKKLQAYIRDNTEVYHLIDPLPEPTPEEFGAMDVYKAARKRYHWMKMSHFTAIPSYRVDRQLKAATLPEFFAGEAPESREGKPLWHAQPRAAVNLRQLLQTETIEFRHFPATESPEETQTAAEWCRDFLLAAFDSYPAVELFRDRYAARKFPTLSTIYNHKQETRWRATTITKNTRSVIEANIVRILQEDAWRPGCDS